jgi:hypothetical protein
MVLAVQSELVSGARSWGGGRKPYAAGVCHSAKAAERQALCSFLQRRDRNVSV